MRPALCLAVLLGTIARADVWLGADKAVHASVSGGLAIAATGLCAAWVDTAAQRFAVAVSATLALGLLKEVADGAGLGSASFKDLTWNLGGALLGGAVAWLIDTLVVTPLLGQLAPAVAH